MLLVSACLAGCNCKYNGKNNRNETIERLVQEGKAIVVCPEILGGLATPRAPAEIRESKGKISVVNDRGEEVTQHFVIGAKKTLKFAQKVNPSKIILKSKSPSCGYGLIYDGSFSGQLIKGNGLTAQLLHDHGFTIEAI